MVIRQGSRPSMRMNSTMNIGTVGMRPINAMEARKPIIQPKKITPRRMIAFVSMWLMVEAMSMCIFSATSPRSFASTSRRLCVSPLNTSFKSEMRQKKIAPVPTIIGMILA